MTLPLSIIFNKSIHSGKCPFMWKYSFITPILKNGDPSVKENYRPISITCIILYICQGYLKNVNK